MPPTTTISSRSTCRRRSKSPQSGWSRRRCSTRTAPPARAASSAGGTACGWRRLRLPTKRAMKRARRCWARPRMRRRTMPGPLASTRPYSAEASWHQGGRGHRRLRRGHTLLATRGRIYPTPPRRGPADNEIEDIAGSVEAPPRCQRGHATQKTRKSRTW